MGLVKFLLPLLCLFLAIAAFGQSGRPVLNHLEDLIKDRRYSELEGISAKNVAKFRRTFDIDSMVTYFWYEAVAIANLRGLPAAEKRLNSILENDI